MARIRTIKPDFFKHSGLYDLEIETKLPIRVAYAGLWTCCDREGRFKWRPRELKIDVLPYDDCDFSRVLDALATRGFVVKYAIQGVEYGVVPTFKDHQVINNRESESVIPFHTLDASGTRESRVEHAPSGEGKGREGVKEGNGSTDASVGHRMFAETVGCFDMKDQAGLQKVLEAYSRHSSKELPAAAKHMIGRYREWQKAGDKLEWQWGSSYKFFMSGKWDNPETWPWKNGQSPPRKRDMREDPDYVRAQKVMEEMDNARIKAKRERAEENNNRVS